MSPSLLVKIMFQRKAWVILTSFVAVLLAVYLLVKAEPVYISGAKLWIQQGSENSDLLRTERLGPQIETHIQVQTQIIRSNKVMDGVLTRSKLMQIPPSKSILAKLTKPKPSGKEPDRIERLKAISGSVEVNVINPEVMIIAARMNTPELAQQLVTAVIEEYQAASLDLTLKDIDANAKYLESQRTVRSNSLAEQEALLVAFEERHPELSSASGNLGTTQSPTFADKTTEGGPVPMISRQLASLELKRNQLAATKDESSFELRSLDEEIAAGKKLLETYLASLAEQGKMQLKHDSLKWELKERRDALTAINKEIQSLEISRGGRLAEESGITILDPPSYDPQKIHPKKKAVLIAALIFGLIAGAGLGLIAHLLDPYARHPEEVELLTGLPVLADLPLGKTSIPKTGNSA